MDTKIKFTWSMGEKDWKRLLADHGQKHNSVFDDVYGNVYAGQLCFDIQHTLDVDDWYAFANVFLLGRGDYGRTEIARPYDLLEDSPRIPLSCLTFEEFKERFEKEAVKYIVEHNLQKEACNIVGIYEDAWA